MANSSSAGFRSMLRYSTRDIALLTTLVAVTIGWLVDHRSLLLSSDGVRRRCEELERQNEFFRDAIRILEKDVEGLDEITVSLDGEPVTRD